MGKWQYLHWSERGTPAPNYFLPTDQPFRKRKVGEIAEREANTNGRSELREIAVSWDRRLPYHAGTHLRARTWRHWISSQTRWPAKGFPQRFSWHLFVCAVCHSKSPVLWMEIRRSRMGAFLISYAHAFSTVTWRHLVLHARKNRTRRSLLFREL